MSDKRLNDILNRNESNYLLPFYWQHGNHRDRIPAQIQRIYDSGCRALCVESRPHPDFCGPDWWGDMDVILEECQRRGMKVWILDDKQFPTGYANGLIAKKYPHLRQWTLVERHVDVMGPMDEASFLMTSDSPEDPLVGVFAYPRTGNDEDISPDPIDLTSNAQNGYLYWNVPEGCYRIFFLYKNQRCGRTDYMDMISEESCHALIEAVYEPHFAHYARYFGNTLAGFFSDEPCFGNNASGPMRLDHGFYGHGIGHTGLALPYNEDLLVLMSEELGEDAKPYLSELWYMSDHAHKTRLAYMNAVTRLWRKCFSFQVGNWCREHGIEYIGHIIEDMNAHARLTVSGGHYFRSLEGQDMSGIDIVLHQVIPAMGHYMHNATCAGGMVDPAFFHYMLGQLAASMARQYPRMKGRAMCEVFGAYGWGEGCPMMKWLMDFLLVRGVNHFVPHAFSPNYPDPDCPPHFGGEGHDPQFDGFTALMKYTNKAAHLLSGGTPVVSCAILYHAEGEWMNRYGEAMLSQVPAQALLDAQVNYDIICADILADANTRVKNRKLTVNGMEYGALVIPYAPLLPDTLLSCLDELAAAGLPVLLCDKRPENAVGEVIPTEGIPARLRELGLADIEVEGKHPLLTFHHTVRDGHHVFMFFNESNLPIETTVTLPAVGGFTRLRLLEDGIFGDSSADGRVWLSLVAGQSEILVFGDAVDLPRLPTVVSAMELTPTYSIDLAPSEDLTAYTPYLTTDKLFNITGADANPHFSGKIRYTFTLDLDGVPTGATLDLGRVGQTARVTVNGHDAGIRITSPYSFPVEKLLKPGKNKITVEVANTLVGKVRDGFSYHMALLPSGLLGPVRLLETE